MDRDRIGNVSIDWKLVAFGIGKYRRKTFGFGTYDSHSRRWSEELYVREYVFDIHVLYSMKLIY